VLAADWKPSARACDLLLDGLAHLTHEGYQAGAPTLKAALHAFRDEPLSEEEELRWLWLACQIARALGDVAAWDEFPTRQLELARRAGAFSLLPVALFDRLVVEMFSGRIAVARSLAAEAEAVVAATGSQLALRTAITLANWRGRDAEKPRRSPKPAARTCCSAAKGCGCRAMTGAAQSATTGSVATTTRWPPPSGR
jgi:hypothetical protein